MTPTPCTNQLTQQLISSPHLPALKTLQTQLRGCWGPWYSQPGAFPVVSSPILVPNWCQKLPAGHLGGCWAGAAARVHIPAELQAGDPRLASRLIDVLDMKYLQAARAWDTIPYEIFISPVNMNAIRMEWLG